MWPFKNKEKQEEKKQKLLKQTIEFKKEKYEIGKTLVKYTLLDGRKFNSWHYGQFFQSFELGRYIGYDCNEPVEPTVGPATITNSFNMAQNMIQMINSQCCGLFRDDEKNPKKTISGFAIAAEIGRTESYEEEFDVAYLADKKD